MRPITETLEIQVPADRLFTQLTARWEAGGPLAERPEDSAPPSVGRIGDGFRVRCPGGPWHLPADAELVVHDYDAPGGWRATSADPAVFWEIQLEPIHRDRTRLSCRVRYEPIGIEGRLRELMARPRRARTLRRLLWGWREDAERQETLRRLRDLAEHSGRGPAADEAARS